MTESSKKLDLFYNEHSAICETILIKFWLQYVQTTEW